MLGTYVLRLSQLDVKIYNVPFDNVFFKYFGKISLYIEVIIAIEIKIS